MAWEGETMGCEFNIPETVFESFETAFAGLVKKAAKLGVAAPSFTVLRRDIEKLSFEAPDGSRKTRLRAVVVVDVTGEAPKLAGWSFLGVVDFSDESLAPGTYATRMVPGIELPDVFLAPGAIKINHCDHCGKARRRRQTYLVRHDDGTCKQVGSSCLRDFLGGADPASIAAKFAFFDLVTRTCGEYDEEGGYGRAASPVLALEEFLVNVVISARLFGFVTGKQAYNDNIMSTGDGVFLALTTAGELSAKLRKRLDSERTDADVDFARAAIAWLPSLWDGQEDSRLTDFVRNLKAYTSNGIVTSKSNGFAASIVPLYQRWLGKEAERKLSADLSKTSRHLGTVGGKVSFIGAVTTCRVIEGDYGFRTLVKVVSDDGCAITWWASGEKDYEIGGKVRITGTVKRHGDYNGVAETTLTRCKLTEP